MGQDTNGWEVIRYTPWKINRDLKITQVSLYKEKGKPSSKPPFLGAMLIFQGVETPEAESYVGTPTRKTSSIWKKRPNGHMDADWW